ncbi:MAG: hypothetical protein AAF483_05320 [Planctomycetota bacterium]
MRITTISSSIASVVCRVIDSVAGTGAVRNFLTLTQLGNMRERMGNWQGLCQMRFALPDGEMRYLGSETLSLQPTQPGKPGGKRHAWHTDIAQAIYAPNRLASARAQLSPASAG